MRVPGGDLPPIRCASEDHSPSKDQRLACGSIRLTWRRTFVGHHCSLGAQRDDFNLSIIGWASRWKLRRLDALAVGFNAAPLATGYADHQSGCVPNRVQIGLLVAAS